MSSAALVNFAAPMKIDFLLFAQHRFCQLIGTARLFKSARIAGKFRCDFFGGHAVAEFCNGFQIAVTTAGKYDIRDTTVVPFCKADRAGACPLCFKRYFFHSIMSNAIERRF